MNNSVNEFFLTRLINLLISELPKAQEKQTLLESLFFVRRDDPDFCWHGVLRPTAALICQGSKIFQRGENRDIARPGEVLLNIVDIPDTIGHVNINQDKPYLSVYFLLNRKILTEILAEMPRFPDRSDEPTYSFIHTATPEFLEAMHRASHVAINRQDAAILGDSLLKELHYLLLKGPFGASIRYMYMQGSNDNRIVEAINYLRQHPDRPVPIEELARAVFMSISSLHRHFKKVTGFSPLQYHKELRLYEAQRLMLTENEHADHAAIAVGYESVTQFNREYKRKFGRPPHQDIMAKRAGLDAEKKSEE